MNTVAAPEVENMDFKTVMVNNLSQNRTDNQTHQKPNDYKDFIKSRVQICLFFFVMAVTRLPGTTSIIGGATCIQRYLFRHTRRVELNDATFVGPAQSRPSNNFQRVVLHNKTYQVRPVTVSGRQLREDVQSRLNPSNFVVLVLRVDSPFDVARGESQIT